MTKQLTSVAIPDTEMRTVHASSVEQDFRISVALPPSYGGTRQRYPVLYLLDADFMFGLVTDVSRLLFFYKEIPEIIVIGIGYPVSNATGALALRTRDLTPTPNEAIYERMVDEGTLPGAPPYAGSGGAGAFLRFIHAELTAMVAESYRVEPTDAGIMGYSFGGLFALFALLTEPRSFRRYMVGSPSIWWDHDALLQIEARTAQDRDAAVPTVRRRRRGGVRLRR